MFNTGPLAFGNLIAGATTGTVTIATNGSRSVTGGVTQAGGLARAASFEGMNDTGGLIFDIVRVTIPTAPITLTRTGGGATMTVSNFTSSLGAGILGSDYYFIAPNAVYAFTVGGRLNVGANQMQGTYTGTFEVEADYE